MAKRRQKGRPVDGILVLDKPAGMTSNEALQQVKYLFYAAKAGHTGSLDPLATGVLPVCLGEATKFTQFLLEADKVYQSTFSFGLSTETGDSDGETVARQDASGLTREALAVAMEPFRGEIEQVPSMYSALKHKGQPLYKLARQGIEVEREARKAHIYRFDLLDFRPGEMAEAEVEIHCSKGTYIRTLAEDLGKALGVGAHVSSLRRTAAGPFTLDDAVTLPQLEALREGKRGEDLDFLLQPLDSAVGDCQAVELPENIAWYFRRGQPVTAPSVYRSAEEGDIVRIFCDDGGFLGVGEVLDDGRVTPRRLVAGR
ncbi:MAG TPA: tRNA pseudouridine(55) synthase TruB [Porticoccaceae bacterium]|nr:tRNA pseudouridine(55) synthase TruB [Porticoccaceae bacterium]HCO58963.1 tRNA pseudouridine(55) synthase TruB [Porticoccaceae bacterium]